MVSLKDFRVGQTVIMVGRERGAEYEEVKVETVGRKYVTVAVNRWRKIKFEKSKFIEYALQDVSIYGSSYLLYPTLDSYLKKKEHDKLVDWVEKKLPAYARKFTNEQLLELRRIAENYIVELLPGNKENQ